MEQFTDVASQPSAQVAASWKPFSLTHVTYPSHSSASPSRSTLAASSSSLLPPLLALLSLTPPFAVCALTSATLIHKDVRAAFLLAGSVLSSLFVSIVKKIIRQPRPPRHDTSDDEEVEYGMPSNHSCFAWFLAAFAILHVLRSGRVRRRRGAENGVKSSFCAPAIKRRSKRAILITRVYRFLHRELVVAASLAIAAGCSYSRLYLRYHTPEQVCAGSVLGAVLGALWHGLYETRAVRVWLVWFEDVIGALEDARVQEDGTSCIIQEKKGK